MSLVEIARLFLFVREVPPNHGLRVNAIQKWGGGQDGDSWCCFLATMWLDLYFQGNSPVPRTGVCQEVYELALEKHWIVDEPQEGDIVVLLDENGRAHHIGVVTVPNPLTYASGNTSPDGTSVDGTGCFEHYLITKPERRAFIRVPGV